MCERRIEPLVGSFVGCDRLGVRLGVDRLSLSEDKHASEFGAKQQDLRE